jgi:hypothetical protein
VTGLRRQVGEACRVSRSPVSGGADRRGRGDRSCNLCDVTVGYGVTGADPARRPAEGWPLAAAGRTLTVHVTGTDTAL